MDKGLTVIIRYRLKTLLRRSRTLRYLIASLTSWVLGLNTYRKRGRANQISGRSQAYLFSCAINITGTGNTVALEEGAYLTGCRVDIWGDNNTITIGRGVRAIDCQIHVEDANGVVEIGQETSICGKTHLAVTEGTALRIGANCLFSKNVTIRTGDSHSILDARTSQRLNPSKDVTLGDRIWVANSVIILKGAKVASDSIVASGAVVVGRVYQPNAVIAGNPAREIRRGVKWIPERVKC